MYLDDLSGNDIEPVPANSPEHLFSHLVLGHSYKVGVSAVNAIGEGARSPTFDLHTGVVPSKMTGSSAPVLDSSTPTSITIRWLPPVYNGATSLTEYGLYHDIGQTGSFQKIPLVDLSATVYTLSLSSPGASSLTTGQIVDFYMTSANVIGESEASDVLTLYVAAVPSKPDPPIESRVFPISSSADYADGIGVQVNWTAPASNGAPIRGYRFFMAEEQSPFQLLYDGSRSSRPDILSFTVMVGIRKSLVYHFQVQAVNAVGDSQLSEPLSVLAAVPPTAPQDPVVTGSDSGSVSLEWSAPREAGGSALTGYYIYYQEYSALAVAPNSWLKSALVSPSASYSLVALKPNQLYRIRTVAVNVRGEGQPSSSVN